MKKLKDLCLGVLLNEGEDVNLAVSADNISSLNDVDFNVGDDYIKMNFDTSYGQPIDVIVSLNAFKGWLEQNREKYQNMFRGFAMDFLSNSTETQDPSLNEIVDDDGNIMPDEDMPNNSTNTMVVGPKYDLEKIYKSFVPKSIRFYSGDLGLGIVTW